jgi:nudix-type nucleoside diphosphatase (YffH/AdpP family)
MVLRREQKAVAQTMQRLPTRVDIRSKRPLLEDFFRVTEVQLSHELFNGEMSPTIRRLVFDRGDAVAALLFEPDRRKMILTNQFRFPTLAAGRNRGWILETMAGMIQEGETPEACLMREVLEETGYQIKEFFPIATFYSSPGGSTERIFLYFAEVRAPDKISAGGGISSASGDVEDIQIVEIPADEFFRMLQANEFEDPKVIIAAQWFHGKFGKLQSEIDRRTSRTIKFRVKGSHDQIVGIKTGDIRATTDVDVWVNSESTDMEMDRFFGHSISSAIRGGGAKKNGDGTIAEDTIGLALSSTLNGRGFVAPAMVISTEPGALAATNNVGRIFHVATVRGAIGPGLQTTVDTMAHCMDRVLIEIHLTRTFRSVLVPLLGTGMGGHPLTEVAPRLIERALAFLKNYPQSTIKEIYFIGYLNAEEAVLRSHLSAMTELEVENGDVGSA